MIRQLIGSMALVGISTGAAAQPRPQAQEVTLFSEPGFSGARFTVTGSRTILDLPFIPRSAMVQGSGRWEFCPQNDYRGSCARLERSERDLRLNSRIRSVRLVSAAPPPAQTGAWREIGRVVQRPQGKEDIIRVRDGTPFQEIRICAERSALRLRGGDVQQTGGRWRPFTLPAVVAEGQCSKPYALPGTARAITQVRLRYSIWSSSSRPAAVVVQALPYVRPQPR